MVKNNKCYKDTFSFNAFLRLQEWYNCIIENLKIGGKKKSPIISVFGIYFQFHLKSRQYVLICVSPLWFGITIMMVNYRVECENYMFSETEKKYLLSMTYLSSYYGKGTIMILLSSILRKSLLPWTISNSFQKWLGMFSIWEELS